MKTLIAAFVLLFSSLGFAAPQVTNVIECHSDCWVDQGDLGGVGPACYIFAIYRMDDASGGYSFFTRMIGGSDDDGNIHNYSLGETKKTYENGLGLWVFPKTKWVKSIQFSNDNKSCEITAGNGKKFNGTGHPVNLPSGARP